MANSGESDKTVTVVDGALNFAPLIMIPFFLVKPSEALSLDAWSKLKVTTTQESWFVHCTGKSVLA